MNVLEPLPFLPYFLILEPIIAMRLFSSSMILSAALAATTIAPLPAHAVLVAPHEVLSVDFSFTSDPTTPLGEIDVLSLVLNATCSVFCGAPTASIDLFNGTTWLGNNTLQFAQPFTTFAFTAPTSLFTFRAAAVADFTSIANGTIDGLLKITNLGTATFDFSVSPMFGASVGRSIDTNGYVNGSLNPTLGQQRVEQVPEPPLPLLLTTGLLLWGGVRRMKSFGHRKYRSQSAAGKQQGSPQLPPQPTYLS